MDIANEWDEILKGEKPYRLICILSHDPRCFFLIVFDERIFEPPTGNDDDFFISTTNSSETLETPISISFFVSLEMKDDCLKGALIEEKTSGRFADERIREKESYCSETPGTCRLNLPKNPAQFYANTIVDALNTSDGSYLFSKLESICAKNVKLQKHIYFCSENADTLQCSTFPSLEAFCSFLSAWFVFVPDGVFETSQHRVALNSLPTFVFVSCFRFTGKKLLKDLDLLRTAFHEYPLQYHERVAFNSGNPHYPVDCTIDGSLAIHVNKHGIVTEIEIYLTQ